MKWSFDIDSAPHRPYWHGSHLCVDPHGLGGAGLWATKGSVDAQLWTPNITLIGLVTEWWPHSQVLAGYKVETLVKFLKSNAASDFITATALLG